MPRTIDEPDQIVLWQADELVVVLVFIGIGLMMRALIIALAASWIWLKVYRRFREGHPDGFLQHFGYWYGFFSGNRPSIPNPYIRRFFP